MEKIIFKNLKSILISICILVFILFSIIIFYTKSNSAINDIDDMIYQIELLYNKSKVDSETAKELFKDDYLNRAYAIEFIISNTKDVSLNNELLKNLKNLMEVNSIHIIDSNGEIKLSSHIESIGLNLINNSESNELQQLIKTNDKSKNLIIFNEESTFENKDKIYISVKSTTNKYSVIQIELDRDALDKFLYNNLITTIVKNTPTVRQRAIFLANKDTGNIDTITQNNDTDVIIENVNTKNEFLEKLYSSQNGNLLQINDKFRYLKTKSIDNYIICAYVDADSIYHSVITEIFYLLISILIILFCILSIFKYCIQRYILDDLFCIESNIKNVMAGNLQVEFKTKYDTELRNISNVLNHWKEIYKNKSERMTRIMSSIDSHIAIFECHYKINKNFFSYNIKAMLGLDDDEWNEISKTPKSFENYIQLLLTNKKNDNELIVCNDKFLKIALFKDKQQFYGMIMDKTEDEILKLKIEKELIHKEIEAQTDPLTKLLNRLGIENSVRKLLKNSSGKGIFIMLDLDNFKLINDDLGHPVGDEVLKMFSCCLKSFFNDNNLISRVAGDEFIIFIDEYINKAALEEKLLKLIQIIYKDLNEYHKKYKLSTSIGVTYVNKEIDTYEELYKRADNALYKAKNLGKNTFYIE